MNNNWYAITIQRPAEYVIGDDGLPVGKNPPYQEEVIIPENELPRHLELCQVTRIAPSQAPHDEF